MSKKKFPPYHTYPGLIDSHAHLLHMRKKDVDLDELFRVLREKDFSFILDAGVNESAFNERLELGRDYEQILYSVGIHPEDSGGDLPERISLLREQALHVKVVAIGEIGLDYYWKEKSPSLQKTFMEAQMQLAQEMDLPVIIHNREADQDCLEILDRYPLSRQGVMHCYSSGREYAKKVLDRGYYLSFAGNVTYKNAQNIQEAALYAPVDRILVETDAPYLSPQERRGRVNHPGQLGYTLDFLCRLRGNSQEELIEAMSHNFSTLFLSSGSYS